MRGVLHTNKVQIESGTPLTSDWALAENRLFESGGRELMPITGTPDHHGSHRDLLRMPEGSSPGRVDAIIVPTVRNPKHLETASRLAMRLDCTLVTLHSGKWTSALAMAQRASGNLSLIAVDVPDNSKLCLVDFETTRLTVNTVFGTRKDTSIKRNLGLLLAQMVGWQHVIFLDDDIAVPRTADLRSAAGLLGTYNAVGLSIGGFPDNSVVCHAYREIGGNQQSFIGGGAMAVETTRTRSFFPDIYNEDWFYMLDPHKGLQPIAVTGTVVQSPYEPFREERARMEELGDVLAEGIFWLLDQGGTLDDATRDHWRDFLPRRRRFIKYIIEHISEAPASAEERARIVSCLRASLGRLALIEPDWCEKYLKAWRADHVAWERHVRTLRHNFSAEDALKLLSKRGHGPLSYVIQQRSGGQVRISN